MNPNRNAWNEQQQALLQALGNRNYELALALFLRHHAMVHAEKMSDLGLWSFEDEVLGDLSETQFRCIPAGGEHSIAWNIWHIARIEDVTMNLLVAGTDQLYFVEGWFEQMQTPLRHTGNAMSTDEMAALSADISIAALRSYRVAVGRRTREVVTALTEPEYRQRVDAQRLERVLAEGAVTKSAQEIVDYWGKRDIAGLLLMPATRHNFLHLNECLRLKSKHS